MSMQGRGKPEDQRRRGQLCLAPEPTALEVKVSESEAILQMVKGVAQDIRN